MLIHINELKALYHNGKSGSYEVVYIKEPQGYFNLKWESPKQVTEYISKDRYDKIVSEISDYNTRVISLDKEIRELINKKNEQSYIDIGKEQY